MIEDKQLIRQFAAERSEPAFAELVRRHLKMVYAAALRQVNGDAHLAEDVTQAVFTDFARKAGKLQNNNSIAGWLYTSTRFAAANAVRAEARRREREQTVVSMNEMNSHTNEGWNELRPMIDEALGELGETDREAIVLRYFEAYEFSLIGAALGVSENAARMRVDRALEKLRAVLRKRGMATTEAALAGALASTSAAAVPAQLAAHITNAALTHAASTAAGSATSIVKILLMKKIVLVTSGVLALSVATVVVVETVQHGRSQTSPIPKDNWLTAEPGIKKFQAVYKATSLAPGQTLIMGGWSARAGKRLLVFVTPTMIDPAGNKVEPPFGTNTEVVIDAKFAETSEAVLGKLGLQKLSTEQNDSTDAARCSAAECKSYIDAIDQSAGSDLLSSPRLITLSGRQAHLEVQDKKTISGKEQVLGPSVDVLPVIAPDGVSLDLNVITRYTIEAD